MIFHNRIVRVISLSLFRDYWWHGVGFLSQWSHESAARVRVPVSWSLVGVAVFGVMPIWVSSENCYMVVVAGGSWWIAVLGISWVRKLHEDRP